MQLVIPRWHPARINQKCGHWSRWYRLRKRDDAMVKSYALAARLAPATGKRRLTLTIILRKGQRAADPDSHLKSLLDACVQAGLLRDDNRQSVELAPVVFRRDPAAWGTIIELEDL